MVKANLLGNPTLSESFLQKELSSNVEIVIMCGVFHVSHALLEGEKGLKSMKQLEWQFTSDPKVQSKAGGRVVGHQALVRSLCLRIDFQGTLDEVQGK